MLTETFGSKLVYTLVITVGAELYRKTFSFNSEYIVLHIIVAILLVVSVCFGKARATE